MRMNILGCYGEVSSLPGCSQVAVSHAVFLPKDKRGKGTGKKAQEKRLEAIFEDLGYDLAMCTVESDNLAQRKILSDLGWSQVEAFESRRTGHLVTVYMISREDFQWIARRWMEDK